MGRNHCCDGATDVVLVLALVVVVVVVVVLLVDVGNDYNLSLNSVKSVGRVRSNMEWVVITAAMELLMLSLSLHSSLLLWLSLSFSSTSASLFLVPSTMMMTMYINSVKSVGNR